MAGATDGFLECGNRIQATRSHGFYHRRFRRPSTPDVSRVPSSLSAVCPRRIAKRPVSPREDATDESNTNAEFQGIGDFQESPRFPYKEEVGGSNPSTPTWKTTPCLLAFSALTLHGGIDETYLVPCGTLTSTFA